MHALRRQRFCLVNKSPNDDRDGSDGQDDLIRAYRAFLDARRAVRPAEEYREQTVAEWTEFQ